MTIYIYMTSVYVKLIFGKREDFLSWKILRGFEWFLDILVKNCFSQLYRIEIVIRIDLVLSMTDIAIFRYRYFCLLIDHFLCVFD